MKGKIFRTIILLFLFFILKTTHSYAAFLYIHPEEIHIKSGESSEIRVYVSSTDQEMNAVSGSLYLPSNQFEIINISQVGTLIDFWTKVPNYELNTIIFEGVNYNPGYKGTNGLIFTARIKPLYTGIRSAELRDTQILANDGNGTDITSTPLSGSIEVIAAPTNNPIPTLALTPTPLPVQNTVTGILKNLPPNTTRFTRNLIERLSSIPGVGDSVQKIAITVVQFADQTETSTVALVTSLALLTAPSLITFTTGLSSTINILSFWHVPLAFAGLFRKKKKPWGIVFDSVTKEPLDPVIMTLREKSGKEYHTMTDLYGRYAFWVEPGEYELQAQKTNFTFPSTTLTGKATDGVYDDLYFGGIIKIEEDKPITVNIPMDQIREDLNQIMKRKMGISAQKSTIYSISSFIFYAGLLWSFISFILVPKMGNALILEIFFITLLIRLIMLKNKTWGTVKDTNNKPVQNIIVRLQNVAFPTVKFPPIVTKSLGRYSFLIEEGTYRVIVHNNDPEQTYIYQTEDIHVKKDIDYIAKDITLPTSVNTVRLKSKLLKWILMLLAIIIISLLAIV